MVTLDAARDWTQEVPMRYLASVFCVCTVLIGALSAFDDVVRAQEVQSDIRPGVWPPVQGPTYRDQAPPVQQRTYRGDQPAVVQKRVYRDEQGPPSQKR